MKNSLPKFLLAAAASCAAPAIFANPITLNFKASILTQINSTGQEVKDVPGQFFGSVTIDATGSPYVYGPVGSRIASWSGKQGCGLYIDGACSENVETYAPALLGYSLTLPQGRTVDGLSIFNEWGRSTSVLKSESGTKQGIHFGFEERIGITEGGAMRSEEKNLWLNLGGELGSLFTSLGELDFKPAGATTASGMFYYSKKGCGPDFGNSCGVDPASVAYQFKIDELSFGPAAKVPEPAGAALFGLGLAGLALARRRKQLG
ncbi:PEP-CTERM sorting domain-containing protein [Pseudoduganella sp. R-43]|uniref:PEP-CTERM sorting domain-containing protein n=1 Tax=Pseudoduganella sp. R-43 TaxID=3404063 RepID=UPI003CF88B9E